ncbi:hypothetical protein JTE90_002292 [Oedothorax gibbosus]|uniref:BTB domain-containing protein n=1 Tax=Oedothorax gibbosus TaxID=931172 RepID=A0AAV6TMZ5_9ARAC|nr:hypothetical protein JTE90_002292 [Oedothorax gibbosus]
MACSKAFHTSNPSFEYSFSWEVYDFHLTSLTVYGAEAGLADGKLVLSGTLTFSNYQVSTTIGPLPVEPKQHSDSPDNIKELPEIVKTIYEGGLSSGVITFSVDEKELTAHKSILCSHSPVFGKMFEHKMAENITNKVKIEDADFATFNDFLGYLYTGVVKEDKCESVLSLYSVAKKYQVRNLQEACVSFLTKQADCRMRV